MKPILSNHMVDIPENVDISLKESTVIAPCRGASVTSVQNSVPLERRGSGLTDGGETERNWLLLTLTVVMDRTRSRVLTLGVRYKLSSVWAHFPINVVVRRMVLMLKSLG